MWERGASWSHLPLQRRGPTVHVCLGCPLMAAVGHQLQRASGPEAGPGDRLLQASAGPVPPSQGRFSVGGWGRKGQGQSRRPTNKGLEAGVLNAAVGAASRGPWLERAWQPSQVTPRPVFKQAPRRLVAWKPALVPQ